MLPASETLENILNVVVGIKRHCLFTVYEKCETVYLIEFSTLLSNRALSLF